MDNRKQLNDLISVPSSSIYSDRLVTSSRTWLEVADVMSRDVATLRPDEIVVSAAKVMSEKNISCLVIMDNANVAGILTETDMLRRVVSKGKDLYQTKSDQIMSCPVESIPYNLSVLEASKIMGEKHVKRLPILDGDKLVGIVTQTDLVRALTSYGLWRDISEIMSLDVAGIQNKASVAEAAEAMTSQKISCIVVLDGDEVVGVIAQKDLLGQIVALQRDPARIRTEEIMSSPVTSIPPNYSVFSASRLMEEMNIRRLVVIKDKRLCGVVTQTDIFMTVKNKLQAEEENNIKLLEESESNIYTTDLDGMITYVNPAFMKLLEVSEPVKLIGQPFLPERFWFNPKERKQFLGERRKESIDSRELTLKTLKGKKIYVIVFSGFTKNIHGQINGSQGILYDITAKKELVALKQAEEAIQQLATITEQAAEGIAVADLEDNLQYINHAWATMHGYESGDELVGKQISIFHTEEQLKTDVIPFNEEVKRRKHNTGEVGHKRRDGTTFPTMMNVTLLENEQGRPYAIAGFAQDITEHKRAEEALRQAKLEAEAASETKSQFLANMSHEIRTPMNAIIGFSQILEEEATDEQKEHVDIIRQSCKNLLELIDDILDLSKIEAGRLDIDIADCSLGQLLHVIESMMRPRAKEKELDFQIVEGNGLPAQIRTDPVRLHQCLINLVHNATKFTEQGYVYLKVSLREIDDKAFICFDVEDTGIGIPEDKRETVFDSFIQADGSTTRKYGGTGLGLTITKQLAELLGGRLTLTSEAGKGSVFSLVIPAGVDVTKQPFLDKNNIAGRIDTDKHKTGQPQFSGRALVVEDVKTNQVLMESLLKRLGLQVTIAEDGKEAVQKALSEPFDLIFMDIQMPNMNGYEATQALRKEGMRTPIVALTANAMKGDDKKCLEAGCDDYLAKPIDRRELLKAIGKHLPSKSDDLNEKIDSVKTQMDELGRLSSEPKSTADQPKASEDVRK